MAPKTKTEPVLNTAPPAGFGEAFELENPYAIRDAAPLPEGFDDVGGSQAIEYTDVGDAGRVATFKGTRTITSRKDQKEYILHDFEEDGSLAWSLWGSAALNNRMGNVQPGEVVWIRYAGKVDHPTRPGLTLHQFQVAKKSAAKRTGTVATPPADAEKLPF